MPNFENNSSLATFSTSLKRSINRVGLYLENRFDIVIPNVPPTTSLNIAFTKLMDALSVSVDKNLPQASTEMKDLLLKFPFVKMSFKLDGKTKSDPRIFTEGAKVLSSSFEQGSTISLQLPIGAYGEEWTRKLLTAGLTLMAIATDPEKSGAIYDEMDKVRKRRRKLLTIYTNNGAGMKSSDNYASGIHRTLLDGIESIAQTAAYMTMHKVEGYENAQDLLNDLIESNIFSQFALIVSPATTALTGSLGESFINPTVTMVKDRRQGKNKFFLNKKIIDYFLNDRKTHLTTGAMGILEPRGCPVGRVLPGRKTSGIDLGAKLLFQAMQLQK